MVNENDTNTGRSNAARAALYGAGQVALNHADEAVRAACCDAIMRTLDIIEGATPFGALGCFMARGVDADEIRDRIVALRKCVAIAVAEEWPLPAPPDVAPGARRSGGANAPTSEEVNNG